MNIAATQFDLENNALEIYVSGCKFNCKNCQNSEIWDFDIGEEYNFKKIKEKIQNFDNLIDKICIFGGDLLFQKYDEIIKFLQDLTTLKKEIWLFTGFEFEQISDEIKNYCNYIKTGQYKEELKCSNNIQFNYSLATSNQKIHKIS